MTSAIPFEQYKLHSNDQLKNEQSYSIYNLARHLRNSGPDVCNDETAKQLWCLAKIYFRHSTLPETHDQLTFLKQAQHLTIAASHMITKNHCNAALIFITLMNIEFALAQNEIKNDKIYSKDKLIAISANTILSLKEKYDKASIIIKTHLGHDHPILLQVNNAMATIFFQISGMADRALEYLEFNKNLSVKMLGKNHLISAQYFYKVSKHCDLTAFLRFN